MPIPLAVPLAAQGIQSAFDVAGSKKQADAAKQAARLQAQASRDSLRFLQDQAKQEQSNFQTTEKANYQQYMAERGRLEPYQQLGASAAGTLQDRLGLPRVALPSNPAPPDYQDLQSSSAMPTSGNRVRVSDLIKKPGGIGGQTYGALSLAAGTVENDTVLVEGPDGSRGEVPRESAPWWLRRGGKVVER